MVNRKLHKSKICSFNLDSNQKNEAGKEIAIDEKERQRKDKTDDDCCQLRNFNTRKIVCVNKISKSFANFVYEFLQRNDKKPNTCIGQKFNHDDMSQDYVTGNGGKRKE